MVRATNRSLAKPAGHHAKLDRVRCDPAAWRNNFYMVDVMTNQELEYQRKLKKWAATPIGAAFYKFKYTLSRAWIVDTEAGCLDKYSDKKLDDVWDAAKKAEDDFLALLGMEK